MDKFRANSDIHDMNTRNRSNLLQQTTILPIYQTGPEVSTIEIYNHSPSEIRNLSK
jgi:hypothetical protein